MTTATTQTVAVTNTASYNEHDLDTAWRDLHWSDQEDIAQQEGRDLRVPNGQAGVPRPEWATYRVLLVHAVIGPRDPKVRAALLRDSAPYVLAIGPDADEWGRYASLEAAVDDAPADGDWCVWAAAVYDDPADNSTGPIARG